LLPDFEEFFSDLEISEDTFVLAFFDKAIANKLLTQYISREIWTLPNQLMIRVERLIKNNHQSLKLRNYEHCKGHFYPYAISNSSQLRLSFGEFLNNQRHKYRDVPQVDRPYVTICIREPTKAHINDNLRNSPVAVFAETTRYLIDQGFGVVRMSRKANTPLLSESEGLIIDYPFTEYKSDYADFKLFKDSSFCVSTGFGVDHFASFFEIPVFTINCPLMATYLRIQKRFFLPKVFISLKEGLVLSVDEIVDRKLHLIQGDKELKKRGIELVDNSDWVMKSATKEFIDNNYFLNPNIDSRYFEISSRIASAQFSYLSKQFGSKEKRLVNGLNLESLIIISMNWPNITSPGVRYEKRSDL
jgi:putative glycosyltransferase (TIGR04372 family)